MAKKSVEAVLKTPVLPSEIKINTPENWCWARLVQLFNFIDYRGKTPTKIETGVPFITAKNIRMGYLDYTVADFISREEYEQRQTRGISRRGDILFTTEAPMGNVAIADLDEYSAGQRVITFQKRSYTEWISNKFYFYYILSCYFQDELQHNKTGNTVEGIKAEKLMRFPVPVPPHAEQQRIVERIEYLFAKLDEAKEKTQSVLDSFEIRKAAILHKAFTGELTAMWRKKSTPPPAAKYLQQIIDSNSSFSRKEFKFWNNEDLPEGWSESKIGNFLYFAGRIGWKGLKAEEYTTEGPMLLSVYNLNDGDEVTYHRVYHISKERYEESPEIMVQKGDVLLTKDGAGIGKLGYVKELPGEATINSSLLLLRPANSAVSKYVYYILLGPSLQRIVKERITGSATPHLFQRDIKEFVIPVPSLEEQTEIVRILDSLFAKEQQAKEAAEAVLEKIDLLKKSILARAFRGELGTNDPTEESALELLKKSI